MTAGPFLVFRIEDMLFVEVALVNLDLDGARLVRQDPASPALVVIRLPSQHVSETVPDLSGGFPDSVPAFAAGQSDLALVLPEGEDGIDFSLARLLDWDHLTPATVPLVFPPDENEVTVFGGIPRTAIEFPTRLLLSHDGPSRWTHRAEPFTVDGRTELWHADLHGEDGGDALLRAFAVAPGRPERAGTPLPERTLRDIVTLTSSVELTPAGRPLDFQRQPLRAERFMLTPLGASVRMNGAWDFPTLNEELRRFLEASGFTAASLAAYQHVAGLGRDQFVRVVNRGFLNSGHRASIVTVTERKFFDPGDDTSVAYLQQETHITVQEPEVFYGEGSGYPNGGREMPFRSLRIANLVTPAIDHGDDGSIFWVTVDGADYPFTMIGTDGEGRQVSFTMPLLFVPATRTGSAVIEMYMRPEFADRRSLALNGQTMALAQPAPGEPGTTRLPVTSIALAMEQAAQHPLGALPRLDGAVVRVPAIEQLTGGPGETPVRLHQAYLSEGIEAQPSGAFLSLDGELPVRFAAEKVGGIARPDSAISAITSRAGVLPGAFATTRVIPVAELAAAFGNAKVLGSTALLDILDDVPAPSPGQFKELSDQQIRGILEAGRDRLLPVPILRTSELPGGLGSELRYVWKPKLKNLETPIDLRTASLVLDARTVRSPDAVAQSTVRGELRNFALDFAGVARVGIDRLTFVARPGCKPDISAAGFHVEFQGVLEFVNELRNILPANGFGTGAFVDVTPEGISTGYSLAVPSVGVGVFSLQNVVVSAQLSIPFDDRPTTLRFSISDRHHPFLVSVSLFGGGGFFSMVVSQSGLEQVEGSLEFGGNASLNLGVASGGVYVMGGIYFALSGDNVLLSGYLRCGGYLSVLGLISISVEFYLALTYEKRDGVSEVRGQGSISVSVRVAFFSKTVSLDLERRFAGSAGDPSFADCVEPADWDAYCLAFAA